MTTKFTVITPSGENVSNDPRGYHDTLTIATVDANACSFVRPEWAFTVELIEVADEELASPVTAPVSLDLGLSIADEEALMSSDEDDTPPAESIAFGLPEPVSAGRHVAEGASGMLPPPAAPAHLYGIQSIETGVVFAIETGQSAADAERRFRNENPEYAGPGVIRAVPGWSADRPLGRSPLVEREPTLAETASQIAHLAAERIEKEVAHLERAVELAERDLGKAKDKNDPILIALRIAILDATELSLRSRRTVLASYKAVG